MRISDIVNCVVELGRIVIDIQDTDEYRRCVGVLVIEYSIRQLIILSDTQTQS